MWHGTLLQESGKASGNAYGDTSGKKGVGEKVEARRDKRKKRDQGKKRQVEGLSRRKQGVEQRRAGHVLQRIPGKMRSGKESVWSMRLYAMH